jgi:hypothetical protein
VRRRLGLIALVAALLAAAPPAHAGAPGWSAASALLTAREGFAVTSLLSGQVLVIGGRRGTPLLSTTEVLDPASGRWSPGPGMSHERLGPRATRLLSGKVLVVGGEPSWAPMTAELYDPGKLAWSAVPAPTGLGTSAMSVALADGNVLFLSTIGSSQVYEAATNTWRPAQSAPTVIAPTLTLLADGKVLVAGGTVNAASSAATWLYDPGSDSFKPAKPLTVPRSGQAATLLRDGRVLVAGGFDSTGGGALSTAELYDPATGGWNATAGMASTYPTARGTVVSDGRVLLVGATRSELFDPSAGAWSDAGTRQGSLLVSEPVLLGDGTVLVVGGDDGTGQAAPSARWTPATTLAVPASVDFGAQSLGQPGVPRSIPVTNTGRSPLLIDPVTAGADYTIGANACAAAPIAPGATCTIEVTFAALASGVRDASLHLQANTAQRSYDIALHGQGIAAAVPAGTPVPPAPVPVSTPTATPAPAKPVVEIRFRSRYSPSGVPRAKACKGRVTLQVLRGKTVLDRAAAKLDRRCRYAVTFSFRRTRLGSAKKLTVLARFHGNRYLGATTNRFTVTVPKS